MELNTPEQRQDRLRRRLTRGTPVAAGAVAREMGVSIDTIRRDIIALEAAGAARRVRGGAVPVKAPDGPMAEKIAGAAVPPGLVDAVLTRIGAARTLLIDGGATALAVARALRPHPGLLVMTPSPWVAVACNASGIAVFVIGGQLVAGGGVATGAQTEMGLAGLAAEVAVLGACGLDPSFGLSADHDGEARLKRAIAAAAGEVIVPVAAEKLGRRARFRALDPGEIDVVVTDAEAGQTRGYVNAGIAVIHV